MTEITSAPTPWVSPPGDTIADVLAEHCMTQAQLADRMGFSRKHVNALVKGTSAIEPCTAIKLEAVLGGTAKFWLTREVRYREALARRERLEALKSDLPWLSTLPVADMVRFGWIRKWTSKIDLLAECLRFFGVASVDAWEASYGKTLASFRRATTVVAQVGAVAAWLRQGEKLATKVQCGTFDAAAWRKELVRLRVLTMESNPDVFVPKLTEGCARHGVAVVFVPPPKGCPAFGAARWLAPGKAVLQLSARGKSNDQLWFTFFHEAGHILLHRKTFVFLEGTEVTDKQLEEEANEFAANILIPHDIRIRFRNGAVSKESVLSFAQELGVAPGVVVGRLQKEGIVAWTHLNGLKDFYRWQNESQESE